MKLSKEELLEKVKVYVGDRTDDETISLIEDISDSMEVADDDENWKEKYEELDNQWREKYIARFSEPSMVKDDGTEPEPEPLEVNSFDDLFEEKESD